ncbi:MAG: hypothetical protein JRD93_16865 [Deltaproteobacteria bacterium]|nr:hypothetical protein [Deltaproteobacteria bacterium]
MSPFDKITFSRVKSGIRGALVLLKIMRDNIERRVIKKESPGPELFTEQEELSEQWKEWMKDRYFKKWEKFAAQPNLVETVEFIRMYLDDVRIARLMEIEKFPSKSAELSQQAKGIRDASDELIFLLDLCKNEKMTINASDVHKA